MKNKTELEQQEHIKMLADARDILNKHGLFYLISGSALLGSVRENDLIKWSLGAVLNVKFNEIKKKEKEVIEDIKSAGYKIKRHFKRGSNWKIRFDKGRLNIEIVGYVLHGANYRRHYRHYYKVIPAVFFKEPFGEVEIRGEKFLCPRKKMKYILHLYGKKWVKPIKTNKTSVMRAATFVQDRRNYE